MALGVEYLSFQTLRPQAVFTEPQPHLLSHHFHKARVALGEAIAPLAYTPPAVAEFRRHYAQDHQSSPHRPFRFARQALHHVGITFAERRANQLLVDMPSPFREEYYQTLETIDHHGKSHVKRTRAGIEVLDEHIPEIHLPQWIKDAQLRFAGEHDANQAYQEYRILQGELSPKIDSKWGHGLGGAVMSLAMYKDYARVLHISEDKAKKISFATALMEIAHDNPTLIKQALGLDESVHQISAQKAKRDGGIDALTDAFESGTLDLFSLSPQDILALLQDCKHKKGFDTAYGLGPVFESQYASVLEELSQDTQPLLDQIPAKQKDAIRYATLIAVVSDVMDMILPNDEAFARMFTVPRAIKNLLSWKLPRNWQERIPKTEENYAPFKEFFAFLGPNFWQEAHKLSLEELGIVQRIMQGKPITNAERKLQEVYDIGTSIEGTLLANNPVIQRMMQHYQGMTFVDVRHQTTFFMEGDRQAITKHIHDVFAKRLLDIKDKIGTTHPDYQRWEKKLQEEADYVIVCLGNKPLGIHVYDPEEIISFQNVSKLIERAFWIKQYRQSQTRRREDPLELEAYITSHMQENEAKYQEGERPIPPTKHYDSTGSLQNARTIFPAAA